MSESGNKPEIVVYSGPMCSGCEEVKQYLHSRGLAYAEKNIRGDMPAMIEFRRKGYEVLPVIEIGERVISEYESVEQLEQLLSASGYV